MGYQPPLSHPVFYNGTAINTQNWQTGTDGVAITRIDGWIDAPDVRDSRELNPGRDGEFADNLYLGGRTITLEGVVSGSTYADLQAKKLALSAKLIPSSNELVFKMPLPSNTSPSWTHADSMADFERVSARVIEGVQFGENDGPLLQSWAAVLRASDPRVYSDTLTTVTNTQSSTDVSSVSVSNSGSYPSPATVKYLNSSGSSSGVEISNTATNTALITNATLATSDAFTFDTSNRTSIFNASSAASYRLNNLSPVAIWLLDETAGTIADNAEGTATYDGTYVNGPTLNQTGAYTGSKAVKFDGVNDHVTIPYNANLIRNVCTVEAWSKPAHTSSYSATFIDFTNLGSSGWGITCKYTYGTTNYVQFILQAGTTAFFYSPTYVDTGSWYHVAVTRNTNSWQMYVNGVSVGTATRSVTNISSGTIYLARRANYYGGALDDVAIYPSVLSATTIAAMAGRPVNQGKSGFFSSPVTLNPASPEQNGAPYLEYAAHDWWQIQPGSQNVIVSKTSATDGTLTVSYRAARI